MSIIFENMNAFNINIKNHFKIQKVYLIKKKN